MIVRVPTRQPLSPAQLAAIALIADGWNYHEAARLAGVSYGTFNQHLCDAARRIPGDLPLRGKLIAWYRGASAAVLGVGAAPSTRQDSLRKAYMIHGGRACLMCANILPHATTRPDAAPEGHE